MNKSIPISLVFVAAAIGFAPASAQTTTAAKVDAVQRHSAQRPTALPEDKDLADRFARAAAGYTVQVRILMAAGADTGKLLPMANWLYFNAIDLSDEHFAKAQFTRHVKALADLAVKVNRAAPSDSNEPVARGVNEYTASLNQRLEEGEQLLAKYERAFNTVVQNADGSFTVQAR